MAVANASPQKPACNAQPAFLYRKDTSIPLGFLPKSRDPGILYKSRENKQKCLKITEAIISTTAPPLCSSKGGTAHGEQERNFKLVIQGQRERSPMVTVPVIEGK